MKSNRKFVNYLMAAPVAFALALGTQAAIQPLLQFSGTIQGQETDLLQGNPPTQIVVSGSVKGIGSHVGRLTLNYDVIVDLASGSASGTAELTAANGDKIFTNVVGQGTPIAGMPDSNKIVEVHTITGGTGRFTNLTGSYTVTRTVDLATGLTSGLFEGLISSPGAAK